MTVAPETAHSGTSPSSGERRPPRILHVITLFSIGGATENTLLSVEGLNDLGYDTRILTGPNIETEGSMFERAAKHGVHVDVVAELKRSIHPIFDALAFVKLFTYIRRGRFDIVHTHSSKAGILGRLAARTAGVPIVVHTVHGLPFHGYQTAFMRRAFIVAERFGARLSHRLVAVSKTIVQKALAEGVGSTEQFVVIRSGIELGHYAPEHDHRAETLRRQLGVEQGDLVVGTIARFSILKGHQYIIDAIPRVIEEVPRAKFLFVGSGELEDEFKKRVADAGIADHVIFAGLVEQASIPLYVAAMDVVAHTSLLEGLARVLPQALAARKPVVSFDIDGAHEIVINEKTGYLVPPGDRDRLVTSIVSLLRDEAKRRRFGEAGAEIVAREWSVEKMVSELDAEYRKLLAQHQSRGNGHNATR